MIPGTWHMYNWDLASPIALGENAKKLSSIIKRLLLDLKRWMIPVTWHVCNWDWASPTAIGVNIKSRLIFWRRAGKPMRICRMIKISPGFGIILASPIALGANMRKPSSIIKRLLPDLKRWMIPGTWRMYNWDWALLAAIGINIKNRLIF